MESTSIENIIANLGFPIAICVYLLYDKRTFLAKLSEIIQNNTDAIADLVHALDIKYSKEIKK